MENNQPLDEEDFSIINDDFPSEEKFECWDGTKRTFIISCKLFPEYGYQVRAVEKGKDGLGYEFAAHHPTSPYTALGELRKKMNYALSKRFITDNNDRYSPLHESIEGRITYSGLGMTFVVDGIALSVGDFLGMFEQHEGWQFKVSFEDMSGEF